MARVTELSAAAPQVHCCTILVAREFAATKHQGRLSGPAAAV